MVDKLDKNDKRRIIGRLNTLFETFDEMSSFCNQLENNPEKIAKMISKIIKYAYVRKSFITGEQSFFAILYNIDSMHDDEYREYLERNSKKGFFGFKRKKDNKDKEKRKQIKEQCGYEIDEDINLDDIENLCIPRLSWINAICRENIEVNELKKKEALERHEFYSKKRGFEEVGFTYFRVENLLLDPENFIYYNIDLTGDSYKDYRALYSGERYKDNLPTNPLYRTYEDNLAEIQRKNDIAVRKYGEVFEIENGRHRLLYLLNHGEKVSIPVQMRRRIEDREFNVCLKKLKKDYGIRVYKNNLLDDEPNILVEHNGVAYVLESKEDLQSFSTKIQNGESLDTFSNFPFKEDASLNKKAILQKYTLMIYEKYKTFGERFLLSNFSDILSEFEGVDNKIFFEAYSRMQGEYQSALVCNYNFENLIRNSFDFKTKLDEMLHDEDDDITKE